MLHSMTGFARESAETPLGALTWELRAVNHRFLDLQFRIPDDLRPQEQALRQQLSERLKRGKVECSLSFRRTFDEQSEMPIDVALVSVIAARLREIGSRLEHAAAVDPVDVLRWPGVVQAGEIDSESLYGEAERLLASALDALCAMRRSEGERIAAMLESRCEDILSIAKDVRGRMPAVLEAVRNKQRERIERLDLDAEPERLETELALVAQKLDVDEELDRLESHISEIRDTLQKDEPVGRRLDFLMQELNREANTLGSKSADTETSKASVELKVLIEQMREQIQNVE